ncbi:MAG: TonB-dependent receptor [Gammaproteobacteria bacterium]|nr:MAG: TonB-dependent receptor [Gammaproteobacteria bacterium]
MNYRTPVTHASVATLLLTLSSLNISSASAQTLGNGTIEEIVIVGKFQKSLEKAIDQKRNSASVIEAISAEDIGVLPETAITDSLKRLPGLAQDRDRGNGSQISIRGMGALLSLATLNGREQATVDDSRNVRFDQFPAELISAAQVYKTPQAKLTDGAVSGLVNLETIKPLSVTGTKVVVDLKGTYSSLGVDIPDAANDGLSSKLSVSYIDQFFNDTLGVTLGFSGRSTPIATQKSSLWGYGDTTQNATWVDGEATQFSPWGGNAMVRGGEDSRTGFIADIQWKPSDELEINYDVFLSEFEIEETARGFSYEIDASDVVATRTAPSKQTMPYTAANAVDVLAGTAALTTLRNVNDSMQQDDELFSNGLNVKWKKDGWTIKFDANHSSSTRDARYFALLTENDNPGKIDFWVQDDRMRANLVSASLTDPNQNYFAQVQVKPLSKGADQINSYSLDLTYDFDDSFISSVDVGVKASAREKRRETQRWDQFSANWGADRPSGFIIDGVAESYWSDLPAYMSVDIDNAVNTVFGGLQNPTPNSATNALGSWKAKEDVTAVYLQVNAETEIAGLPLTGNIGVRNVETDTETFGGRRNAQLNPGGWWEASPDVIYVSATHSYSDLLPSTNWTLQLTDKHQIRLGLGKTIARAPIEMMTPNLDLVVDATNPSPGTSQTGNPQLNPFRADQADLAYNWFFGEASSLSVNLFYKDVESYIGRQANAETITFDGHEFSISRPVNGEGGYIRGVELAYTQEFDFLPEPFKGFGIYSNVTFNETNIHQMIPVYNADKASLTGFSENTGNLTLWYYKSGFEARVTYSYRSEFQRDINAEAGTTGLNDAEGYVDLSLSYEFNDNYKAYLQVQNLNNSPYKTLAEDFNNENHRNAYEEFGTVYTLGVTWRL